MAGNNLKTYITADTAKFKKGMKDAKDALKDFEKQGTSALSGIDGLLGTTSGTVAKLGDNIKKAGDLFKQFGNTGKGALTGLEKGMATLGGAIAGLGLTAAIASFKELNRQADIFRNTVEGSNLELQSQAYKDTFRASMEEQLGNGETWAGAARKAGEKFTKIWGFVSNSVIAAFKDGQLGITSEYLTKMKAAADATKNADVAGRKSAEYQGEINRLVDERIAKTQEWQRMQREINEAERTASDYEATKTDRLAAQAKAVELTNQFYGEQVYYATEIAKYTQLQSDAAEDSRQEWEKNIYAQAEIDRIQGEQAQKLKSLDRLAHKIETSSRGTAGAAKETQDATELTLDAAKQLVLVQRAQKALEDQNARTMAQARFEIDAARWAMPLAPNFSGLPSLLSDNRKGEGITVPIKPVVDEEAAEAAIIELADVIENGVAGMSEAIGNLIGDLINGENAWGNFAQAGISVIADMLSTVGKAFIATGTGVIAAQTALKSGNGYAAIAAGAAMVALAATMKAVMSNAASNWGGGYSTSVASSAYTSGYGASAYGREMEVKVTGTLTANGSKLVAVLNNENTRASYTT